LHEAFLSPSRAVAAEVVAKSPPPPVNERPGVEPPSDDAIWVPGYWEWDPNRADFTWVTGTWRVPPPNRFWVPGYWTRDASGWSRVSGFWSEKSTDQIDWRKDGPPADRPADEPGPAPDTDCFYIPGEYEPSADGSTVEWRKGFWSKVQPGWAWVPAQWVRQPDGWSFQAGYWDRLLEDRGTLFSPAGLDPQDAAAANGPLDYQAVSEISPGSYGRLYGAYGRPTSYYDGYPGCFYDLDGRYFGYSDYGSIGLFNGFLDYPFTGIGGGFPYLCSPAFTSIGFGGGWGGGLLGLGGWGNRWGGWGSPFGFGFNNWGWGNTWGWGNNWGWGGGWGGWGSPFGFGFNNWGWGLGGFGFRPAINIFLS
jgi:hypothetical protein